MKILLAVDPELPVPPFQYGGIERIVDGLAKEYVGQGHEVTLIAHPESTCSAVRRIYGWRGKSAFGKADICRNAVQMRRIYQIERPDIVHSFSRLLYLYPLLIGTRARIVQSYQRAISPLSTRIASMLGVHRLHFAACATHLFKFLPNADKWTTIYNFTDTAYFTPDPNGHSDYLVFLGRIEDIKGTKEAIDVALMAGIRIIIAGNVPEEHQSYFQAQIRPLIDGNGVTYIGPVDDVAKRALLRNARAFLFPIKWDEPFGIVLAESLACGVPVLAFNRGSVPEVITDGYNGFVCETVEEMAGKLKNLDAIDRKNCRQSALERFSAPIIAQQYLSLFARLPA